MPGDEAHRSLLLLRRPVLVGFTVVLAMALLREWPAIRDVLLLGFFAVLLGAALTFPIDALARRMSRGAATLVVLFVLIALAIAAVLLAAPAAAAQLHQLGQSLVEAAAQLDTALRKLGHGRDVAPSGPEAERAVREGLHGALASLLPKALPAAATVGQALYAAAVTFALAFFFAASPERYRLWLRSYIPRANEDTFDQAWTRVGTALRHWMSGIIISMTIMGTLGGIGLALIGIEGWLPLAVLIFIGTFVPYVGAVISTIPGLAIALAHSPAMFAWALLVYGSVHVVEGMIVEPLIMRRAAKLHPAVLLLWQLLMGATFGLPGVVVATPLLACVQEATDHLYVEQRLGKRIAED